MKKVIITLETAEFYFKTLQTVYDLTKDGLTASQKAPYVKQLSKLQNQIQIAKDHDEDSYYHETLDELYE